MKCEMSKTLQDKELSTSMICDAGDGNHKFTIPPPPQQLSTSIAPKDHGSQLTKYAMRKEQH